LGGLTPGLRSGLSRRPTPKAPDLRCCQSSLHTFAAGVFPDFGSGLPFEVSPSLSSSASPVSSGIALTLARPQNRAGRHPFGFSRTLIPLPQPASARRLRGRRRSPFCTFPSSACGAPDEKSVCSLPTFREAGFRLSSRRIGALAYRNDRVSQPSMCRIGAYSRMPHCGYWYLRSPDRDLEVADASADA
jgi:hypothetical protein